MNTVVSVIVKFIKEHFWLILIIILLALIPLQYKQYKNAENKEIVVCTRVDEEKRERIIGIIYE